MSIVNLTHEKDGSVRLRRSVTTKLAIGLPPDAGANFPKKLDHFVFQKKASMRVAYRDEQGTDRQRVEVVWVPDPELQKFYGDHATEVWIVLLDDDPDVAFRTELAWWTKTQRQCYGDGEVGHLKTAGADKKPVIVDRPCANRGCPEWNAGICKPSGDLYFILADFPSLGTICKLHTTSFQSIGEVRTALEDLRSVTGGRLLGVKVKLTVRIEKNVFSDKKKGGARTTSTKHVVGLKLDAADVKLLTQSLTENMRLFESVKLRLGGRSVEVIEDPDTERAPSLAAEFYPPEAITPAPGAVTIEQGGRGGGKTESGRVAAAAARAEGATVIEARATPATASGNGITDDDLPEQLWGEDKIDPTPWSRAESSEFFAAWTKSGRKPDEVRDFLMNECKVLTSLTVPAAMKGIAMKWARTRPAEPPPPPATPLERECREMMGMLALDLMGQMRVIEECGGDWAAVKIALGKLADLDEARGSR